MWLFLLLAARLSAAATAGCGGERASLEIRNVNVINVETGDVLRNATIAVNAGRVCRIGAASTKHSRADQVIDGRGRYAVPGFLAAGPLGADARWVGYGVTQLNSQASLRLDQPNADLHDQLALMVAQGRTPLQALQAATLKPNTGQLTYGDVGGLTLGSAADIVLFEQDPRVDIANTRSISLVVLHGQPLGLVLLARARAGRNIDLQPFSR